ncbi:MAG: hypothetical protein AAFR16_10175 [Pseudomonadota bacterium]
MNMKLILAGAFALGMSSAAVGQSTGGLAVDVFSGSGAGSVNGPAIGGDFTSDVDVGNVTANARGEGATAVNQVGSASSGAVGGDVDTRVRARDITATAEGKDACAVNQIGSLGGLPC